MPRLAVIDCGTNTFHLLVADVEGMNIKPVFHTEQAVWLGEDGLHAIGKSAMTRAIDTLLKYTGICNELKVRFISVTGTAAFRKASNSTEFVKQIKRETGIDVKVISGEEEAFLIYKGVVGSLPAEMRDKVLIMDIGGGSTEFIIGDKMQLLWKISLPIGASVLKESFQIGDILMDEEVSTLENYLNTMLTDVFDQIKAYNITVLIGSSGSFDTLTDIIYTRKNREINPVLNILPLDSIASTTDEINSKSLDERMFMPGMKALRAGMMPVAGILIKTVLKKAAIEKVYATQSALKEGLLLELAVNCNTLN